MWIPIDKETVLKIQDITEYFQNDCHSFSKSILSVKPTLDVDAVTNIWMYKKMAEFEFRLRCLENYGNESPKK